MIVNMCQKLKLDGIIISDFYTSKLKINKKILTIIIQIPKILKSITKFANRCILYQKVKLNIKIYILPII